jgi:DNA-binding CsgD family transcriptional regulator
MFDDEELHDLIGGIYEAASSSEYWGPVVRRIKAATGSYHGQIFFGNPYASVEELAGNPLGLLSFEHDDLSLTDFVHVLQKCQDPTAQPPYAGFFETAPLCRTVYGSDYLSLSAYKKTDFYHQLGKLIGFIHVIACVTARKNGQVDSISFYRANETASYELNELRLLDILVPHIRRSLSLHRELQFVDTQAAALQRSIDALTSAIVLVNQVGKVVFLNTAGEQLLKRCPDLCISRDRLRAGSPGDTVRLEHLTKRVTGADGQRPSGGALPVQRANAAPALQVIAAPLPIDNRAVLQGGSGAVALLMIHDPSAQTDLPQDIAATLFGLTPAEAQLLLALSHGQSLKDYSEEAQVSQNTARTQLRSIFAKTNTSRQSDLVRLMSGLAHSVVTGER